jgi:hypothetical protein
MKCHRFTYTIVALLIVNPAIRSQDRKSGFGREVSIVRHLRDGEEFEVTIPELMKAGEKLFSAKFTIQEGAGRPLSKGTGASISDFI